MITIENFRDILRIWGVISDKYGSIFTYTMDIRHKIADETELSTWGKYTVLGSNGHQAQKANEFEEVTCVKNFLV